MNKLADALIDAIAYIDMPSGDDDRDDDDCRQLECLDCIINRCSKAEKKALIDAVKRAIAKTKKGGETDHLLLSIYEDILSDFRERFSA